MNEVSESLSIKQVKCFADDYSKSSKEYDEVISWINKLEEVIEKR